MCRGPWHTAKYAATWAPNQDFAVCHTVSTRQTSPLRRVPRARGTQRSRPRRRQLRPTPFVIFILPCAMNNTRRMCSPCARYMTHDEHLLRRGWPTAKRRWQPLPRRRECSPCVKYRAHGEHIRRVLFVAHGEIKVTNGIGRSQLRRVLAM